jgi:hypothetical protein
MSEKEQKYIQKNCFFFQFPITKNDTIKKGYKGLPQKPYFIISVLLNRFRLYPRRTLMMLVGLGITLSIILNDVLGWGNPGYGFVDKIFLCLGLLGCAFGFITPKIELNEIPV